MSDSAGFAISMPDSAGVADSRLAISDVSAVHSFWFGRRLWPAAFGLGLQAALLLTAGVFLLTQIASTPNLAVQIALTGGLMTIGGIALLFRSLGTFRAGLKIDCKGVCARLGWRTISVPWSRVERWSVSEQELKLAQLPGIVVWVKGNKRLFAIPNGHLDNQSRHQIHQLFHILAYGKEAA
jgi:hypothetical protein